MRRTGKTSPGIPLQLVQAYIDCQAFQIFASQSESDAFSAQRQDMVGRADLFHSHCDWQSMALGIIITYQLVHETSSMTLWSPARPPSPR